MSVCVIKDMPPSRQKVHLFNTFTWTETQAKCLMFMHVLDSYGNIMNCLTSTVKKESITLNKDNPLYKQGDSLSNQPEVPVIIFFWWKKYNEEIANILKVMDVYLPSNPLLCRVGSPEIRSQITGAFAIFVALYANGDSKMAKAHLVFISL